MNGKDKEEILVAIARLEEKYERLDSKLEEKYDNLERYVFKDLKPDLFRVHATFRWLGMMVLFINAVLGLIAALILKGVI